MLLNYFLTVEVNFCRITTRILEIHDIGHGLNLKIHPKDCKKKKDAKQTLHLTANFANLWQQCELDLTFYVSYVTVKTLICTTADLYSNVAFGIRSYSVISSMVTVSD